MMMMMMMQMMMQMMQMMQTMMMIFLNNCNKQFSLAMVPMSYRKSLSLTPPPPPSLVRQKAEQYSEDKARYSTRYTH
jgi:hypothetical protein